MKHEFDNKDCLAAVIAFFQLVFPFITITIMVMALFTWILF